MDVKHHVYLHTSELILAQGGGGGGVEGGRGGNLPYVTHASADRPMKYWVLRVFEQWVCTHMAPHATRRQPTGMHKIDLRLLAAWERAVTHSVEWMIDVVFNPIANICCVGQSKAKSRVKLHVISETDVKCVCIWGGGGVNEDVWKEVGDVWINEHKNFYLFFRMKACHDAFNHCNPPVVECKQTWLGTVILLCWTF